MIQNLVLVCLFLIPTYVFRFSVFGIPTNFFEIAVLIAGLYFAIDRLFLHKELKLKSIHWSSYLLLLAVIFGLYFASDRSTALGIVKGWFLVPAVLSFLVLNTFDKTKLRLISIPLFCSMILVSLWAILQKTGAITTLFYQVGDKGFSDYLVNFRAFGPFESPNYLAMFIVPMIFLTLPTISFFKRGIDRILILSFYLFPLFALYSSHSLGGLLAFGFGMIALFAFGLTKTYRAKLVDSGWKTAVLTVGLIIVATSFALIFSSISKDTYSNAVRRDIYRYSYELVKSHPITGIGLGGFQASVENISKSNLGFQLYGLSYALHPHNLYVAFWLNLGIVGIIALLWVLVDFFWSLGRRGGNVIILSSAFAAMTAIMIHGLVDTTYFKNDLAMIFWLLIAIRGIVGARK